jgi:LysR family cys regulon transcriptional activator
LHARYTLLRPFKALQKKYPKMRMFMFQADPADIPKLAFEQNGVVPNIIVQANDSDIIKAYVSDGLGIGIVPSSIVDRRLDAHLRAVDVTDLFARSTMNIIIRENMHLRSYVRDFIEMVAPDACTTIKRQLNGI